MSREIAVEDITVGMVIQYHGGDQIAVAEVRPSLTFINLSDETGNRLVRAWRGQTAIYVRDSEPRRAR